MNCIQVLLLLFSHSVISNSWYPMDCSLTGFPVPGISQARILKWGAISLSRWSCWLRDQTHVSCFARGSFITEPPRKPTTLKCTVDVFFFMEEGPRKANIYQCYDVTWACPTLSPKCLVDILPNGHFFTKTPSASYKSITLLPFLPY